MAGAGNTNTAMFWEFDTRLGRRWNLDPKPNPSISYYACFENNPIQYTDIFGDTTKLTGDKTDIKEFLKLLGKRTGNKYGVDANGFLILKSKTNLITNKSKSGTLSNLVNQSIYADEVIEMNIVKNKSNVLFDSYDNAKVDIGDISKSSKVMQALQVPKQTEENRFGYPYMIGNQ